MNTSQSEPMAALDQPLLRRSAASLCATLACLGTLTLYAWTGSSAWALAWLPVAVAVAVATQDRLFGRILAPVARLLGVVEGISRGEYHQRVRSRELGHLAAYGEMVNSLCEAQIHLERGISTLADRLQQIPERVFESMQVLETGREGTEQAVAEADTLLANIDTSIRGINQEVESLSRSIEEVSSSILQMRSSTDEVARSAGSLTESVDSSTSSIHEIGASIRQVAQSADAVRTMAEEAATAMAQMDRAIQEVSGHVREASGLTEAVSHGAELGQQAVSATIDGMEAIRDQTLDARTVLERLAERIGEIGEIVNVIGGINEETNLLSLNAAIIAAQAGEQGKAFAVVANHVKTLAQRTASSTQEIEALIRAVQVESGNAVTAMGAGIDAVEVGVTRSRSAGEALGRIRSSARDASQRVAEIARATGEQTRNSKHVAGVAQHTSQMVQQISAAMSEQSRASGVMLENAEGALELCRQVHRSTEEQRESGRFITDSINAVSEMIRSIHANTESHGVASRAVAEAVNRILRIVGESGERIPQVLKDLEELRREADTLLGSAGRQPAPPSPSSATPRPARSGSASPRADGRI